MTLRKKMQPIIEMVIARAAESDNMTYVPVIKVNIIAITEKMLSPVNAWLSFDTLWGSRYIDRMK